MQKVVKKKKNGNLRKLMISRP